jgi:hypothetical protein
LKFWWIFPSFSPGNFPTNGAGAHPQKCGARALDPLEDVKKKKRDLESLESHHFLEVNDQKAI